LHYSPVVVEVSLNNLDESYRFNYCLPASELPASNG
jgi:hypothetical protein